MRERLILMILLLFFSIDSIAQQSVDSSLLMELERMLKLDQLAASNSESYSKFSKLSQNNWKDSVYRAHQSVLENVIDDFGFPGYDFLGKRGSQIFWLMVQHSDFDPDFQKRVLDSMYVEVLNNNANAQDYAFLTDRVNLNFDEAQIYGTQVTYDLITGRAKCRNTKDPIDLDKRRAEIGLEPIDEYLNNMTKINMQYQSIVGGITNFALLLILITVCFALVVLVWILRRRSKSLSRDS